MGPRVFFSVWVVAVRALAPSLPLLLPLLVSFGCALMSFGGVEFLVAHLDCRTELSRVAVEVNQLRCGASHNLTHDGWGKVNHLVSDLWP